MINASPDEIAWVENATRAWNMAFYGLDLQPGDRVIKHASEYASSYLALLQQARRRQFEIDVAPSDDTGRQMYQRWRACAQAIKPMASSFNMMRWAARSGVRSEVSITTSGL